MKIKDKIYQKYGTNEVIIPPPISSEDFINQEIIPDIDEHLPSDKISPFLSNFVLQENDDSLDPNIFEAYEPESLKWRQNKLPEHLLKDFEDLKKEDMGYLENIAPPDAPTVPPPRARKVQGLLNACESFAKKAVILPPAGDELHDFRIPESKIPRIEDVDLEKLNRKMELFKEFLQFKKEKSEKEEKSKKEKEAILSDPINSPVTVPVPDFVPFDFPEENVEKTASVDQIVYLSNIFEKLTNR